MREFLAGRVVLHEGDCLRILAALPDALVDSVVCDPPYGLEFMGREWDGADGFRRSLNAADAGRENAFGRLSQRGPEYRATALFQEWCTAWAAECLRILKPGGYLVAFGGTRTYHRLACAIEDAGFEIRDQLAWCYGSGFPKSMNIAKAIDKKLGAKREVLGIDEARLARLPQHDRYQDTPSGWQSRGRDITITAPATEQAAAWDGWGTALKPAWEPIVLARKPLIGTVADNVLKHGVGGINIDACRVDGGKDVPASPRRAAQGAAYGDLSKDPGTGGGWDASLGRWPANIVHDGSDEVLAAFPDAMGQQAEISSTAPSPKTNGIYGKMNRDGEASASRRYTNSGATNFAALPGMRRDAAGSAARFYYAAKADAEDRLGSKHPTVKPIDLMQWLVRLVTPQGGTCLDPFAGTGTTGEAAWRDGMNAILIEREPEYQADIARRMELAANPTKRAAVAKSKNNLDRPEDLPLFSMPGSDCP